MSPTGLAAKSKHPFTLLEVLMVAIILVGLTGLAATTLAGFGAEARFSHGLNSLATYIDTMRHRAVALRRPLRMVYDLPSRGYWVELIPADRDALDPEQLEDLRLQRQVLGP